MYAELLHRVRVPSIKPPFNEYGVADSMSIFDHVFVPWDRVFMCGEYKYAGRLALSFANNHRFSYCGCKPAVTDVIMGATALVADYNGVGKAPHIVDEVSTLMVTAELVYAAGHSRGAYGQKRRRRAHTNLTSCTPTAAGIMRA